MSFSIGDRVQITGTYNDIDDPVLIPEDEQHIGATGVITDIDDQSDDELDDPFPYLIHFDEPVGGFADNWFNESELTAI